ncbi:MAG: glutamate 5-kinase [Firmicutes bacterium]|nr:glutamate 5-kinase [Bacillota bacterium]
MDDVGLDYGQYFAKLTDVRRLVVKVGTSTLTYSTGKLNFTQLERLVRELADLQNQGKEVLLVTSGAVGAGVGKLGLGRRPRTIPEKQAAAAVGMGILMHMYEKLFAEYGQTVAQVLLTRGDIGDRRRYLNARYALCTLLQHGVIPIINENDTVAVEELRFGDNDTLSALVAGLVDANLLIILSDIDGLYTADPRTNPEAVRIPVVKEITPEIECLAHGKGSELASGGMITKIQAAKIACSSGIHLVVAHGQEERVIGRLLQGEPIGTLFLPKENKYGTRQRWIAFGTMVQGTLTVDAGAEDAIVNRGKSLLPSGITRVEGNFEAGNVVKLVSLTGAEIARGIVNYSSEEIEQIKGKHTREIANVLGYKDYDEVIHRNNLTLS